MPGTYAAVPGMGECSKCPANTYSTTAGLQEETQCISCSIAMYSLSGSTECSECPVGTYGDTAGKGCTKCPEGKSTNELKGQTVCIDCPPGYAQANVGAATCDECAIDLYSTGGALACTKCEGDTSTLNVKGASVCSSSSSSALNLRNREDVLKIFKTGMAYMITLLLCIAFASIGALITAIRNTNATIVRIPPVLLCGRLALSALSMISEAFMIAIMFAEGTLLFKKLGLTVVIFRAANIFITGVVLIAVFGGRASMYKICFDREHYLTAIYPYSVLSFIALLDCSLIALLPWKYSEFAEKSQGFPDMISLRCATYYRITQDLVRFICNVIYLVNVEGDAADASVETMTYFNILASVATIVLAGMVAVMKNSVLLEVQQNSGTAADLEKHKSIEGGEGGEGGDVEMSFTDNPLHGKSPGEARCFSVMAMSPTMPLRSLLIELLSGIDASSLHAVDQAFKRDGVKIIGEFKEYVEGGVIGLNELKKYATKGKLTMSDTMKLVKAAEDISPHLVGGTPAAIPASVRGDDCFDKQEGGEEGKAVMLVLNEVRDELRSQKEMQEKQVHLNEQILKHLQQGRGSDGKFPATL